VITPTDHHDAFAIPPLVRIRLRRALRHSGDSTDQGANPLHASPAGSVPRDEPHPRAHACPCPGDPRSSLLAYRLVREARLPAVAKPDNAAQLSRRQETEPGAPFHAVSPAAREPLDPIPFPGVEAGKADRTPLDPVGPHRQPIRFTPSGAAVGQRLDVYA